MVHGAIDGCSRVVVFLKAANNNRACTVMENFVLAARWYGVPSRVRTDHGCENGDVAALMEAHRGPGRGSIIQGKSVHNQRIERLWGDVWSSVVNTYYDLFRFLEADEASGGCGALDITNDQHVWALHYVYLPRINQSLQKFRGQWNNHGLRTEHHMTPNQIFVKDSLAKANTSLTAMQDLFNGRNIEASELTAEDLPPIPDVPEIQVPAVPCPLPDNRLQLLKAHIDPLREDGSVGVHLFRETLRFIQEE